LTSFKKESLIIQKDKFRESGRLGDGVARGLALQQHGTGHGEKSLRRRVTVSPRR